MAILTRDRRPPQTIPTIILPLTSSGRPRSISAAAKRIDLRDRASIEKLNRPQAWVEDAWRYSDAVPEIKFAIRFVGNALSRLRLYPGVVIKPDEPPASIDEAVGEVPGITQAIADAALDEMARLSESREGQSGILRAWGEIGSVSGDSWFIGREEDGDEVWELVSESNVLRKENRVHLKLSPSDTDGVLLDDGDVLARIWRKHPRWPQLADSNMRAILAEAEELLIYARQFRAVGRSRTSAGILLIPSELDPKGYGQRPPVDPDEEPLSVEELEALALEAAADADPTQLSDFEEELFDSMVTPISDDASAAAVMPHLLRGKAEYLRDVRLVDTGRKIDEAAVDRINLLIRRLAHGLDVPPEILTGIADVNHWNAWQVEESTYKAHIEPHAGIPAAGLTHVYLRPALVERGIDPGIARQVVLGLDPSGLVARPNRSQDAKDAHQRFAISNDALRRYLGMPDSDAPELEELALRILLERSIGGMSLTRELINVTGVADVQEQDINAPDPAEPGALPPAPPAEPAPQDEPVPEQPEGTEAQRVLVAAIGPGALGPRLAGIDARVRERMTVAASDALTDALRTAGSRLRARVQGDAEAAALIRGVPPTQVGQILGASFAAAGEVATDDLLAGSFDRLEERWTAWVGQAQTDVSNLLEAEDPEHGPAIAAQYRATADEDRDAGWLLLLAALTSLATSRIFTPTPEPDLGEFDPSLSVEPGHVRRALARAGGAHELDAPPAAGPGVARLNAAGGVGTGERAVAALRALGRLVVGWEWRNGAPTRPFPPHHALAGVRFTSWDDGRLTNGSGFPPHSFYYPGDHRGCQCDAVPVILSAAEITVGGT